MDAVFDRLTDEVRRNANSRGGSFYARGPFIIELPLVTWMKLGYLADIIAQRFSERLVEEAANWPNFVLNAPRVSLAGTWAIDEGRPPRILRERPVASSTPFETGD